MAARPAGPGRPRLYMDGQLYGIETCPEGVPDGWFSSPFHYVSVLVFDRHDVLERPTWHDDVLPIMRLYANLYPVMSRGLFDLADYECVVRHIAILRLSFSLPLADPNSMPVTRDLSAGKRATLLRWLDSKDPATGLPYKGTEPERHVGTDGPTGTDEEPVAAPDGDEGKVGFAPRGGAGPLHLFGLTVHA